MREKNKGLKYEVYQTTSKSNKTYIIHRYYDDKNANYEYQIYELVNSMAAAKECGITDIKEGRDAKLNTREVCDLLIKKIKNE